MLFPYTAFGFVLVATCLSLTAVSTAQTSPFVSRNNEGWSHDSSNDSSTNFACSADPLPYDTLAFSHAESLHNLPRPALDFLFHLEANLSVVYPIGDGPLGNRQSIIGSGGRVEGPKIKGTLLPGSTDWLLTIANGTVAIPDARFHIQTDDGAFIYAQSAGYVTGPPEIMAKWLTDPSVTPYQYRFRLRLSFETGDPRYYWMNFIIAIASAAVSGGQVVYDSYEVR